MCGNWLRESLTLDLTLEARIEGLDFQPLEDGQTCILS